MDFALFNFQLPLPMAIASLEFMLFDHDIPTILYVL